MERNQIISILKLLKTAYPKFYANMSKEEAEDTINLWEDMFRGENPEIVIIATKNLISRLKFPPNIADVKEEIDNLQYGKDENPMELYAKIKTAMSNGIYGSVKEFEKLPEVAQKFVVNPERLRNWAMQEDLNHDVLMSQFIKWYDNYKNESKLERKMIPEAKALVLKLTEKMMIGE